MKVLCVCWEDLLLAQGFTNVPIPETIVIICLWHEGPLRLLGRLVAHPRLEPVACVQLVLHQLISGRDL